VTHQKKTSNKGLCNFNPLICRYFKLDNVSQRLRPSRIHVIHSLSLKMIKILVFSVISNVNTSLNWVLPIYSCIPT